MLHSLCHFRGQYNRMQGPDERSPDITDNDFHSQITWSRYDVLDIINVPSIRKGGEERLSEDIGRSIPGIFRHTAYISRGNS